MSWNWKREIAIVLSLSFVTLCAPARSLAQGNACTESRGKRIEKVGGTGAAIGAIIGAIVNKDGHHIAKSMGIGAAIGGGIGILASVRKPAACSERPEVVRSPYNSSIADASELAAQESSGPGVLLRNVVGADPTALNPILIQDLPKKGFGLVDAQMYQQNNAIPVRYDLDVTVTPEGSVQGAGGGGFSRVAWSQSGNQSAGATLYQVSVNLIDTRTGRTASIATMSVTAANYATRDGSYTVANVYGYQSQSVWSNDPATGSAIAAINVFFGATPRIMRR